MKYLHGTTNNTTVSLSREWEREKENKMNDMRPPCRLLLLLIHVWIKLHAHWAQFEIDTYREWISGMQTFEI